MEADPVRFLARDHARLVDEARSAVAAFLGADREGLVFVPNATTGVSTVLRSLRFERGDEILVTDHEYNATLNAAREVTRSAGATVRVVPLRLPIRSPEEVVATIVDAVGPRTRLALVSHVTSPTAIVLPIEEIVRELDRRGVDTLVDDAHGPGQVPLDLGRLGAAYWTGNGHKWLCGPKGSGVLHVRADRRSRIRPLVISHGWNDRTDRPRLWREFDWMGTTDPTPFLALPEAIRVVATLHPGGWPGAMAANRSLALDGRAILAAALGVEPPVPAPMVGSMAALPLPSVRTDAEAEALERALYDEDRIEVPITAWPVRAARADPDDPPSAVFVRISAQLYNERADYERLADALARRVAAAPAGIAT